MEPDRVEDSLIDQSTRDSVRARAVALLRPQWYLDAHDDLRDIDTDPLAHFETHGFVDDRSPCSLFEPVWYREQVGDVPDDVSAIEHYLANGWCAGFDPHPAFDSSWYRRHVTEMPPGISPLEQYIGSSVAEEGSPHPLFDGRWYVEHHRLDLIDRTAMEHFLEEGWVQGLDPSTRFHLSAYLEANPDVRSIGGNPFVHFLVHGIREGRRCPITPDVTDAVQGDDRGTSLPPSIIDRAIALLRPSWYLQRHPDVRYAGADPVAHFEANWELEDRDPCALFDAGWYHQRYGLPMKFAALRHYLTLGHAEGNSPGPAFHTEWYLRQASDIPAGMSPLEHYVQTGWLKGFDPHPLFSTAWYVERAMSWPPAPDMTPFEHYLELGWHDGDDPGPLFNTSAYLARNADVVNAGLNPFLHYIEFASDGCRPACPLFDVKWYIEQHSDDPLLKRYDALGHLQRFGISDGWPASEDPLAAALARQRVDADQRARRFLRPGSVTADQGVVAELRFDWDGRAESLSLETRAQPRVSVVIPTLDHSEDVIRCLESIAAAADTAATEVIVVDDGSKPEHAERFRSIAGLRLVTLDANVGFADACAAGANVAMGEYLMLLNNDTEVLPGWVDALVAEMDRNPTVGVAGSMIVRGDLRLQEAGVIVWADGRAHQYGSSESPLDWRYRTRREADYCSGASLLVRRSLWDELGGFDKSLRPAYYEDADLCFAARKLGYRVVYQPASVVFHHEGTSHGRGGYGSKRLQFRNRELFRTKWAIELAAHLRPTVQVTEEQLISTRDRRRSGHVLVVDHRVLEPDQDAGSLRMYRIIEDLVERGLVVHFCSVHGGKPQPWTSRMQSLGVEVVDARDDSGPLIRALAPALEFALVSRPEIGATFLSSLLTNAPLVPIAYDMVDAHAQRLTRRAALHGNPELLEEAERFQRLESSLARISDVVVTVSDADETFIQSVARTPLTTVRIPTVHLAEPPGRHFSGRRGLLFVGGFEHHPNVDAAKFLAHEVFPLIQQRLGSIQLTLVGSKPPAEVRSLARSGIDVTGWVADLRPYYDRARVVIAPVRFGAGVKGKIGEALSFGVPTVTTAIGVEGIALQPGRDILVADSPEDIADAVASIYEYEDRWTAQAAAGAAAIEAQFGRHATHLRITELVETMARVDPRRLRKSGVV